MKRFTPRLWPALCAPLIFAACATISPPQPPSLDLPKPPGDLRAVRKGDQVILTWTIPSLTTDRQTVRSVGRTRICRSRTSTLLTQCGPPVGEALPAARSAVAPSSKEKPTASYTDVLNPSLEGDSTSSFVSYAIEVTNKDGRSAGLSNQVRVPLIRTLTPPQDFQAHLTSAGVVLTWTNNLVHDGSPGQRYVYRVYRRAEGSQAWILAGEVASSSDASLKDANIEWQKTYEYRGEAVTIIENGDPAIQVEGADSPLLKVFADDVFPPAVPSGLQAVFSGPGQQPFIDLIWAPVPDVDLDGYNVYRREEGTAPAKLNATPVKSPAYRDANVVSGKRYLYSVSAVDVRGNESAHSEEAGETAP